VLHAPGERSYVDPSAAVKRPADEGWRPEACAPRPPWPLGVDESDTEVTVKPGGWRDEWPERGCCTPRILFVCELARVANARMSARKLHAAAHRAPWEYVAGCGMVLVSRKQPHRAVR
jgi:hypothetical protein